MTDVPREPVLPSHQVVIDATGMVHLTGPGGCWAVRNAGRRVTVTDKQIQVYGLPLCGRCRRQA